MGTSLAFLSEFAVLGVGLPLLFCSAGGLDLVERCHADDPDAPLDESLSRAFAIVPTSSLPSWLTSMCQELWLLLPLTLLTLPELNQRLREDMSDKRTAMEPAYKERVPA